MQIKTDSREVFAIKMHGILFFIQYQSVIAIC